MATDLTYGGIKLSNVQTLEFSQAPQRDPSNTDQWFHRIRIRVRSLVNAGSIIAANPSAMVGATVIPNANVTPGQSGGDTAQSLQVLLRASLGQDRGTLLYQMEGQTVIQSDAYTDTDNGPKVVGLDVFQITPLTLRIEFAIETALIFCPDSPNTYLGQASPNNEEFPIINNRWACIDDVDDRFVTTRTWRGVMRISNSQNGTISPHIFRHLMVPPLYRGWKRQRMDFVSEPDGLTLGYSITDQEMAGPAAPWPAARMQFTHTETVGTGSAGEAQAALPFCIGSCQVRLEGGRGADKRAMISWAVLIIQTKLSLMSEQSTFRILEFSFADHQGNDLNVIEAQAKIAHIPPKDESAARGFLYTVMLKQLGLPLGEDADGNAVDLSIDDQSGNTIDYDPDEAVLLSAYGTATIATLYACALQTPCGVNHYMANFEGEEDDDDEDEDDDDTNSKSPSKPAVTYSQGPVSTTIDTSPGYSDDQNKAIYQFYQVDSQIRRKRNRAVLPIAVDSTSDASEPNAGDPTVTVCELAAPTSIRTVRIHGERLGDWPTMIADADFEDQNGIQNYILDCHVTPRAPILSADGQTYYYAIDQELVYAMERPTLRNENVSVGTLPWDTSTPEGNAVPPDAFVEPDDPKYGIA